MEKETAKVTLLKAFLVEAQKPATEKQVEDIRLNIKKQIEDFFQEIDKP